MAVKYVCNSAKCFCNQGTASGTLDVKSQSNIFIQEKLIATEDDITFKPLFFGNCKLKKNDPCTPVIETKWENPVANVYVGNKKALLESSELICTVGGKIKITDSLQTGPKIVIFDNYSLLKIQKQNKL